MDIKARILQFTFRAAAGRFFTRVGKDQFDNIAFSGTSVRFTGHDLELNTDTVNTEILGSSDIRLVSGFINTIDGDFPISTQDTRRVEIDGVTLLFDCVGGPSPPPADTAPAAASPGGGLRTRSSDLGTLGRIVSVESLYSSMVEEAAQVKQSGGASQQTTDDTVPKDVDACAEALNATVKMLLLNTVGILHNVTIRLRVPPPGLRIVPGAPLPPESIELFIHVPRIDVTDATSLTATANGSFRKQIYFSGFVVQAYDAAGHAVVHEDTMIMHEMNLADTILQGEPIDIEGDGAPHPHSRDTRSPGDTPPIGVNMLDIDFNEAIPDRPIWTKRLSISQVHAVLTPAQLVRVLRVFEYVNRAPTRPSDHQTASGATAAAAEEAADVEGESRLMVMLMDVSLALLHDPHVAGVEQLWHRYNTLHEDLAVGLNDMAHYSVRLQQFRLTQECPMRAYADPQDVFAELFQRFRGSLITVVLNGATVTERQPSAATSTVILSIESLDNQTGANMGVTVRTSYPVNSELARQYNVNEDPDAAMRDYAKRLNLDEYDVKRSPNVQFALHHVLLHTRAGISVFADVEILDRLLLFAKSLNDVMSAAAREVPEVEQAPMSAADMRDLIHSTTTSEPMFYSALSQANSDIGSRDLLDALEDMQQVHDVDDDDDDDDLDLCSTSSATGVKATHSFAAAAAAAAASKAAVTTPPAQPAVPKADDAGRPSRADQVKCPSPATIPHVVLMSTSVTARFHGVAIELKFPTHRPPQPDLYGPDTVRLFEALRQSATPTTAGTPSFLPRTLVFRCDNVAVNMPTGSFESAVITLEAVVSTMHDVNSGEAITLLAAMSPPSDASKPARSGRNASQPTIIISKHPDRRASPLDLEGVEQELKGDSGAQCRARLVSQSALSIDIKIPVLGAQTLYRDNYLLLLFMINELSDCVAGALDRDARRWQEAALQQTSDIVKSAAVGGVTAAVDHAHARGDGTSLLTTIKIRVERAGVAVRASRLGPTGQPIGEALWSLLTPQVRQSTSGTLHFHRYSIEANEIDIFMAMQSPSLTETLMNCCVTARSLTLSEDMPPELGAFTAPVTSSISVPRWGTATKLLESYAAIFERVHDLRRNQIDAAPHVLQVFAHRRFNTRLKTDSLDATLILDRVIVTHQPAHDGDHWLFVLMAFFADAPVVPKVDGDVPGERPGQVVRVAAPADPSEQPYNSRMAVAVGIRDVLLEYGPYGRSEKVVMCIPSVDLYTGELHSASPKSEMKVYLPEPIAVMMHDAFDLRLIDYHRQSGRDRASVFGRTRRGIQADLTELGFVPIAVLSHTGASKSKAAPPDQQRAARRAAEAAKAEAANVSHRFVPGVSQARLFESMADLRATQSAFKDRAQWSTKPRIAAVRLLSNMYADRPFVVDIGGLDFEVSAAWDSFAMLRAVAVHWAGGGDTAFLPTPFMLVSYSGPQYASMQPPVVPQPPPRADPGRVGAKKGVVASQQSADGAAVEAQEPVLSSNLSEYDVVDVDENGHEIHQSPQAVAWVPGGYDDKAEAEKRHARARAAASSASVDDFNDITIDKPDVKWAPNFLSSLFTAPKHLSRANTRFRRRFGHDVPAIDDPKAPPTSMQIVVHDSTLRVCLAGGSDFEWCNEQLDDADAAGFDMMFTQNFRPFLRADGRRFIRSTRHDDEQVVVECLSFFLQLDVYQPGYSMQQQLQISTTGLSALDLVATSPVRQVLWCEVPVAQRDRPVFEFKWVTYGSSAMRGKQKVTYFEEEIGVRCLPLHLSLSRVTKDLLARFAKQADRATDSQAPVASPVVPAAGSPAPSSSNEMFFRRFMLHGLSLKFSWYPDLRDLSLLRGNYYELMNLMNIEGSAIELQPIDVRNASSDGLLGALGDAVLPQLYNTNVIFLFAGFQPVRTATEVAGAVGDLVLTPLEYFKNNKSLYNGLVRGLAQCSRRLAGESLRVAATTTRLAHDGVHWMASPVAPHSHADPIYRGDQPETATEGVIRGAHSVVSGVRAMGAALRFAVIDSANDTGSLVKLPLSVLLPVDGVLRGLTDVLLGTRNGLQPERRRDDVQEFKSNKFSGAPRGQ